MAFFKESFTTEAQREIFYESQSGDGDWLMLLSLI